MSELQPLAASQQEKAFRQVTLESSLQLDPGSSFAFDETAQFMVLRPGELHPDYMGYFHVGFLALDGSTISDMPRTIVVGSQPRTNRAEPDALHMPGELQLFNCYEGLFTLRNPMRARAGLYSFDLQQDPRPFGWRQLQRADKRLDEALKRDLAGGGEPLFPTFAPNRTFVGQGTLHRLGLVAEITDNFDRQRSRRPRR